MLWGREAALGSEGSEGTEGSKGGGGGCAANKKKGEHGWRRRLWYRPVGRCLCFAKAYPHRSAELLPKEGAYVTCLLSRRHSHSERKRRIFVHADSVSSTDKYQSAGIGLSTLSTSGQRLHCPTSSLTHQHTSSPVHYPTISPHRTVRKSCLSVRYPPFLQ